jgi:PAS domain S-box-containing protein
MAQQASTAPLLPRLRPLLALVPPAVALVLQLLVMRWSHPHVWFLFYPAIFISSWIGDRRSATAAMLLATGVAWWFLVEPRYTLIKPAAMLFPLAAFLATGALFITFHGRLRRANARLEEALDRSRIFEAFLANSSDFAAIADADGSLVYVNPAGRAMVGLARDFPIERTRVHEYYPADHGEFVDGVILKATADHGQWKGETWLRHWQTQEPIAVSDTHFVIRESHSGRTVGIGTISRDITALRQAREELTQSNHELARANAEVTRLYEQLTRLDEHKTRFFADVSHEFRTPLTLILGPIDKHLRAGRPLPHSELKRDLEVVDRNARTLLQHVNDLLDVARLDAGRLEPEYVVTDIAVLVRIAADHFSTFAAQHQLEVSVDAPPALLVETDHDKVQRIILNLLSNAFKFVPRGGRVRIAARTVDGHFRLEVADSGPGVPRDRREEIFERFRRFDGGPGWPRQGTGLGLSIVRDFAALLGGTVTVEDPPEGGAAFVLDLPAAAPAGAAVGPPRHDDRLPATAADKAPVDDPRSSPSDDLPRGNGTGRVLVVEDNADLRGFITDSLARKGFTIVTAGDGSEACERALAERPDLIITDVLMPNMSGEELVGRLRQHVEFEHTPIVILTAKCDDALRVRLLSAGAQDYLDKPFSTEELGARVRNLIVRKHAEDHLEKLRDRLESMALATSQIAEAVAGVPEESVRTVFQTIALNAQALTGAEFAAAALGGDPGRPFEIWASAGFTAEQVARIGRPPQRAGLLAHICASDQAVRMRDVRTHPLFRGVPAHHPELTSFLGVPIRHHDRTVGTLFLANKRGASEFTSEDQQVVETLAARAGAAVETARLYAAQGRAHAWLQSVVDQMPEGVMLMDGDGRVRVQNLALRELGLDSASSTTDRFGNAITLDLRRPGGERLAADELPIEQAIVTQQVIKGCELIGRRADDQLVPLLVSAAPILTSQGGVAGAAMVVRDVSKLKELERLREEWASVVAHDLEQPIGVITLRSALLLRDAVTEEQRTDLQHIRAAAERLRRMASDLMDASLLESRRMRLNVGRTDLGQLLHDVVASMPQAAGRTTVRLAPTGPVFVKADGHRLEQVVSNLLSNALKYSVAGSEIELETRVAEPVAEILVSDVGDGIPASDLPMIFERFVRAREGGGVSKGSGLGLYIARGLVEAHGGRIWAESAAGGRTTFHVTLPLDAPLAVVDPQPAPPAFTAPADSAKESAWFPIQDS